MSYALVALITLGTLAVLVTWLMGRFHHKLMLIVFLFGLVLGVAIGALMSQLGLPPDQLF